jgi:hypothetical protein
MDVRLLWVLCVARYRSLRRAGPSSRGVLPTVVCLSVIMCNSNLLHLQWVGRSGQTEKERICLKVSWRLTTNVPHHRRVLTGCHGVHGYSPTCHRGGHGSVPALVCGTWSVGQVFLQVLRFSPVSTIRQIYSDILITELHDTALSCSRHSPAAAWLTSA